MPHDHPTSPNANEQLLARRAVAHALTILPARKIDNERNVDRIEDGWSLVHDLILSVLPEVAHAIVAVGANVTPVARPVGKSERDSVTFLAKGAEWPKVLVAFDGTPGAMLRLAHEYGHAVQLVAAGQRIGCTRVQETCAFLFELLFLEAVDAAKLPEAGDYRAAFHRGLRFYGHAPARSLVRREYAYDSRRYEDSYVLALFMARFVLTQRRDCLPALFSGDLSWSDLAHMADMSWPLADIADLLRLPEQLWGVPAYDAASGPDRFYAFIGVKALADILQDDWLVDVSLPRWFTFQAKHSQRGTTRFLFDVNHRLRGYIIGTDADADPSSDIANAARVCIPWGNETATLCVNGDVTIDVLRAGFVLGCCIRLLAASETHKSLPMGEYLRVHIIPALQTGQVKIWHHNGRPAAFVTWRLINSKAREDLLDGNLNAPQEHASSSWNYGQMLHLNDVVAPTGVTSAMRREIVGPLFQDFDQATAVRYYPTRLPRPVVIKRFVKSV